MKVDKEQYDNFPSNFKVTDSAFQFYYADGDLSKLSVHQKALCYYFICEGIIDNGGMYSLLLETSGEFTAGYMSALDKAEAIESKTILQQIDQIYKIFDSDFSQGVLPPELDDESDSFDHALNQRIENLEKEWFSLSDKRTELMNNYFAENKDELIKITSANHI